jgi:hypothetical protein
MTGIPILDSILEFIETNKTGFAMVGIAVVGLALLIKPVFPSLWERNREAIVYMVIGGVVLAMIPTLAALIVGS